MDSQIFLKVYSQRVNTGGKLNYDGALPKMHIKNRAAMYVCLAPARLKSNL
jgi:hypothetical protein